MSSATGPLVVVAAAIIRPGPPARVLAACRSRPAALAGRWELPGGKVEPGETDPEALARECREELGVEVRVHARLGPQLPTTGVNGVLRAYLVSTSDEPSPREHAELRWLTATELDEVDWLDTDRPLLEPLRHTLTS